MPQTPMRTRCASRPRYRTAGRSWSSQGTTSTRRRPTISRGPSTRRAGRRRHGTLFREREPTCVITDRVATPQQDPCTRGSRLSLLVTRACRHFVRFVSSGGRVVASPLRRRGRHRRGDNAGVYPDRPKMAPRGRFGALVYTVATRVATGGTSASTTMACRRLLLAGPSRLVRKTGSARVAPLPGWHLRQGVNPHGPLKSHLNVVFDNGVRPSALAS